MHTIRRLLSFETKYWKWMVLNSFCLVMVVGINVIWPQFKRLIIDRCFIGHEYHLLPYYAGAIAGTMFISGIFWFSALYLTEFIAQKAVYDIRNRLFDHIQRLSFSYHDEAETGQLISRATSDVDMIRQFLGEGIMHLTSDGLLLIGVLAVCFYTNWRLALATTALLPFLVFSVYKFRSIVGPLFTAVQDQVGDMTTAIQQNLMGIRVVKAFAREEFEIEKFSKQARELYECATAASRVQAKYQPLMDLFASVGLVLVLWYGGFQVIHKHMTVGALVAFYEYIVLIVWPVRILGWVVMVAQWAVASGDRIFEILDTHPEVHLKDGQIELDDCSGVVEFKNVAFAYNDGGEVLSDVCLRVESGEMVAFVGATGSGKSTIINLLPRFYDVNAGSLLVDGVDIRDYHLSSLRRNIGIVSQETFLFGDSVRENIAYGNPDAPLEEVIEAAKSANIHDFIMSLPNQYETRIGERGVNLSGGQKQRVAIARALLMNPPILILDDSTSSVDTETEGLIQKALVSLTESRTTFVVAQRISTIKRANKIVVLDNGRIVECGTHDVLLKECGTYSDIYHMQFRSQETAPELEAPSASLSDMRSESQNTDQRIK